MTDSSLAGSPGVGPLRPTAAFMTRRKVTDRVMRTVLFICAAMSVAVTTGIVYILISESLPFFGQVSIVEFLTGTQWTPLFADPQFGILPLLSATAWAAGIALFVAIPLGLTLAVYLSEYAPNTVREVVKPFLELLEAVPTVVYGYFALLFLTPLFQQFIPGLSTFNLLVPGVVLGIMILPYVTSVSEDAMRAVPGVLREGAYGLGFTRYQTAVRVIIPAAFSGITAAFILGMSRAVGETMVLAIAAGQNPNLLTNPLEGAATITAFIVQVSMGDVEHGGIAYQSIFAAGFTLFLITLGFNILGFWLRQKFREAY